MYATNTFMKTALIVIYIKHIYHLISNELLTNYYRGNDNTCNSKQTTLLIWSYCHEFIFKSGQTPICRHKSININILIDLD